MQERFANRHAAGQALVAPVRALLEDSRDVLVLGLPRGGVPVARELADALDAELDVLVVRKLGLPHHPEYAMGAIASGGARVLHDDVLARMHVSEAQLQRVEQQEREELTRREQRFRGNLPPLRVADRVVILVDDGVATGATMEAAVEALRSLHPRQLLIAVPVASRDAAERLHKLADYFVCLTVPEDFRAVGLWYEDFGQVSSDTVQQILEQARARHGRVAS